MSSNRLTENEIRPDDLMDRQQIAMTIDIGRLLVEAESFVIVDCPACENDDCFLRFSKYGLKMVECRHCGTIYTNPRPPADVLAAFYKDSVNYAYWNEHIFPASEDVRRQRIFVPRVDKVMAICEQHAVNQNSLIEVGAAFGTFCVELESRGKFQRLVAIEPTPGLAETCRRKGLEVIEEMIENIEFPAEEKFDVVVNFEVIEHLFSPQNFILHCKRLLNPGGLLILTCPNGKGFDFVVLGEKCNSVDHEHLNYFNPESLSLLVERCGLEVLDIETPGRLDAELVRKKILSGELDTAGQPFLQQVLIDKWDEVGDLFQNFLATARLSSNMLLVARLP